MVDSENTTAVNSRPGQDVRDTTTSLYLRRRDGSSFVTNGSGFCNYYGIFSVTIICCVVLIHINIMHLLLL